LYGAAIELPNWSFNVTVYTCCSLLVPLQPSGKLVLLLIVKHVNTEGAIVVVVVLVLVVVVGYALLQAAQLI
jgi:hypothetical protein